MSDVAVIGGGIVGCALAAFLAEGGAEVTLYEREAIAAGASGRNSGVVQHPLDDALDGLYEESLTHYRELEGFELPEEHVGLLLLGHGPSDEYAGLSPTWIEDAQTLEPALAPGHPRAAAGDRPARAAGGGRARVGGEGATGGSEDRDRRRAGRKASGSSPPARGRAELADLPITPVWGVVVELELPNAPVHVLEEAGIDALTSADVPDVLFSAVTARGISAIGSTFLPEQARRGAARAAHPRARQAVPAGAGHAPRAAGPARGRGRSTAARSSGNSTSTPTWPAATGRGGSRSGRRRRGSSRIWSSEGRRRSRRPSTSDGLVSWPACRTW